VAFIYRNGLMRGLPEVPGTYIDSAYLSYFKINGKDHVVGISQRSLTDAHLAWISKKGVTQELAPDSDWSEAYAINDLDQVVGMLRVGHLPNRNDWPVIWKKGIPKLLNTLAGYSDHGRAVAINNPGWVVGQACNATACTPFIFNLKKMFDLNTRLSGSGTGWTLIQATGINDAGVIVGTGSFDHELHAVISTPVAAAKVR